MGYNVVEEGIKHELDVGATLCTRFEKSKSVAVKDDNDRCNKRSVGA